MIALDQMTISWHVLMQGVIVGIPYGLLAIGLVLIHKVSRFINFAQGAVGAFGGALVGTLVVEYGVPYWIAFVVGLAAAAGIAAAAEAVMVRRLAGQPRLLGVVVTLLLSQFLLAASFAVNPDAQLGAQYPQPAGIGSLTVGDFVLSPPKLALVVLSPLVIVALVVLLRRTSFGLAIRATASNPDAAYALGISPHRVARRTWALAGAVAAFAAILLWPTQGFGALVILGPSLILRGLIAAAIARFSSVPGAFAAGVVIGVVDTVVRTGDATSGAVDILLVACALVVLLFWPPREGRESAGDGDWTPLALPPVHQEFRRFFAVRHFGTLAGLFVLANAAYWGDRFLDSAGAYAMTTAIAFAVVGLSVLVLTGRAGQLSLGQFAVAAIGAVVSVRLVAETGQFALGLLGAMLAGALLSMVLGLPSLRARGVVVAVTTLAFALATRSWILPQDWALGTGREAAQPVLGPWRLDDTMYYFFFALLVLAAAVALTRWVLATRLGRDLVAIRDNEGAAQALGVPVVRRKMEAFAFAGALAGLGGSLFAHSRSLVTADLFPAMASIEVVVLAVVGGLAVTSGPVLGAIAVVGVPLIADLDPLVTAGLQLAFLGLVVWRSGGLVAVMHPVRDWAIEEYVRLHRVDPQPVRDAVRELPAAAGARPGALPVAAAARGAQAGSGDPAGAGEVLALTGVTRSFGGIRAVRGVDLHVAVGETVALIGPNGAGKTTLFEIASGFVRPDSGQVAFHGRDVTRLAPQARARRGLVRSFQNALLFPTLTVEETLRVAHRGGPWTLDDLIEAFGLTAYAGHTVAELPTGVRRITELACDLSLQPDVLLLDEPSAGIAHAEIPALAALLRQVNQELGVAVVVIDHDMTLLRGVCSRFVALDQGAVIASGPSAEVLAHPDVVRAFLGSGQTAERSAAVT